jgi:hypothetical protein
VIEQFHRPHPRHRCHPSVCCRPDPGSVELRAKRVRLVITWHSTTHSSANFTNFRLISSVVRPNPSWLLFNSMCSMFIFRTFWINNWLRTLVKGAKTVRVSKFWGRTNWAAMNHR